MTRPDVVRLRTVANFLERHPEVPPASVSKPGPTITEGLVSFGIVTVSEAMAIRIALGGNWSTSPSGRYVSLYSNDSALGPALMEVSRYEAVEPVEVDLSALAGAAS